MYIIKYSKLSSIELDIIYSYISDDNNFYAIKVIKNIYKTIEYFRTFPYIGKPFGNFREFVENKYKFRIIYEVDDSKNIITIVSIFKNKNNY